MSWYREEYIEYVEGATYTKAQLDQIATQMLREDADRIIHECDESDTENCECKKRGIGGENPILFESHLMNRKKREIMVTTGTPDPSLVQGIYIRSHPNGRKVNSPEARKAHGLGYYQ